MTCKFRITIPAGSIDLVSPMGFWECHAAILEVMGIKDQGPVKTQEHARQIAEEAARKRRMKSA